ncbi:threonine/serine exporter family protein [Aquabacter spiritensis]|uniref:Uncharacterized membrane protein YjjP (DUF1212 family) n=1 Tax=Aquabacter spiritensis TaxID=933073 RepID=A0A4R3LZJ8_9HYPH|nr:threonine/serine exporter family protein [Aquabacter spiritensis]TCT04215.1 uncharacterized membrane protein YjjP (DUF1212 family) [Aquabacter spiritensis]
MATPAPIAPEEALALVRISARLLFANGQTTRRCIDSVVHLGACLGLTVEIAARWGELDLRVSGPSLPARLEVIAVTPAGVEMHKVTETLDVMDKVCLGTLAPAQARAALDAIDHLKPISLLRFAAFAGAGAAALAVIFGAVDPVTLLLIFASAAGGACVRRWLSHVAPNPLPQPLAASFLAGLVAAAASHIFPASVVFVIALCPCMILVPGPHLLNSALDLARMRLPLGGARLGYAALLILMICIGLLAGLSLGAASLPLSGGAAVPLAIDVIAAGIAVAAFGTYFSMPWRMLPFPMAVGMAGHAVHWATLAVGAGLTAATFATCFLVGAVVTPLANRMRLPFAAVAFASVVSLMPGSFLFRMSDALIGMGAAAPAAQPALLIAAIEDATTAVAVLVAMALGLILPKVILERLFPPTLP